MSLPTNKLRVRFQFYFSLSYKIMVLCIFRTPHMWPPRDPSRGQKTKNTD